MFDSWSSKVSPLSSSYVKRCDLKLAIHREALNLMALSPEFMAHHTHSQILFPPFRAMLLMLRLREVSLASLIRASYLQWKVILLSRHRVRYPRCSKIMPFSLTNA